MKKMSTFWIVLLLIAGFLSNGFAQEYAARWNLPEGAKARFGKGKLNNIILSPDGTRAAVSTSIGIWVYDAHTAEIVSLFTGIQTGEKERFIPKPSPQALTFSADALVLASVHGNSIYVWDTATGTAFAMLDEHPDVIKGIALSPDKTKLATAAGDWTVRLWDVATGKYLNSLTEHPGAVNAVAFSPDGKILASAGIALRLWNADTGELLHADNTDLGSATQLVFSPDGKTLASGGGLDRMGHLWDVETGTLLKSLKGLDRGIREIVFSPDSDTLVTVGSGSMRIWDVRTGTEQKSLPTPIDKQPQHVPPILNIKHKLLNQIVLPRHRDDVHSVRFSKDGEHLVSASSDGSLHVWDVETGLYQQSLALGAHTDLVSVLAFSEDSKYLAGGDRLEERIRVWDVENAAQHAILTPGQGDPIIRQLTVSPGIKKLAGSSLQGTIQVWDATTLQQLSAISTERMIRLLPFVFSPDGKFLAGRGSEHLVPNKMELWQTDFGDHPFTLEGHTHPVRTYIFSPDSNILASGGDDAVIILWEVNTGNRLANLRGHTRPISALTFSPDGKTLASGTMDKGEIRLWDVNTGTLMSNLDAALNVAALAFSPDGKTLAGASGHMIILWKLETTFQPHAVLRGHQGTIYALMFSPDGKTLASGSADGTILLWDMEMER